MLSLTVGIFLILYFDAFSSFKVKDLVYPETIKYTDVSKFSFLADKQSFSEIDNLEIKVSHSNFDNVWDFESFDQTQTVEFELKGNMLNAGENEINIITSFINTKGEEVVEEYMFVIELVDLTFKQRVSLFFDGISNKVVKLTKYSTSKFLKKDLSDSQLRNYSVTMFMILLILASIIIRLLFGLVHLLKRIVVNDKKLEKILKRNK